jgi:uncharacterized membrane protein
LVNKSNQLFVDRVVVQFILRAGLVISLLLMVSGIVVNLLQGLNEITPVILNDVFNKDLLLGNRLLGLGIFALALTPVARVATLSILWIREKDWKFVMISLVVLVTLIFSITIVGK